MAKNQTIWFKNGQTIWISIFPKKTYRCRIGTWTDSEHHEPSEDAGQKQQWAVAARLGMARAEKTRSRRWWRGWGEKEPQRTGGNVNSCRHYGRQDGGSSQNEKWTPVWFSNCTFVCLSKANKNINAKIYLQPHVIVALFTITKTWKQPECSSMDEWIMKL